ncbi:MAG: prepilin-type N-terminal cleavage/methylation domain-containing protein [Phycisphaerae bacterium]
MATHKIALPYDRRAARAVGWAQPTTIGGGRRGAATPLRARRRAVPALRTSNRSAPPSHAARRAAGFSPRGRAHAECRRKTARRRGLSLLELMIAVGILGVGLIMVAAIFPVAITQHKENIEHARAIELINKAKAVLHSRFDGSQLWVNPNLSAGQDSPWYTLPVANLEVGATTWDAMLVGGLNYADRVNGVAGTGGLGGQPSGNFVAGLIIAGLDPLSDRLAPNPTMSPFADSEFMEVPNRFAWIGFYRHLATGTFQFAAAICKQSRNDRFVQQNVFSIPGAATATGVLRRLPVPWRVTVGYNAPTNRLLSLAVATEGIGELAPRGSRIMIAGWVGNPAFTVPTGRVLTVTSVYDSFNSSGNANPNPKAIEVLEDIRDLPDGSVATFDVWVFPPPVVGGNASDARFGKDSPLVEWKMNL